MYCHCVNNRSVEIIGLCNPDKIKTVDDNKNWTELSIPELLYIPCEKPPVETIDKVFINVKIISKRVVKIPKATGENEEGTKLTGWKLIIEGVLCQKIVYTADLPVQSVHSAHFNIPFSAFIMLGEEDDDDVALNTKYCVEPCVEDVFVKQFGEKQIFKNVTLLLRAYPLPTCTEPEPA